MIVPLVREPVWRPYLDGLPSWQPPLVPTTILSPHPDDETLGAGGLILHLTSRNIPVSVVAVTDGENAYDSPLPELASIRTGEQTAALARLGVAPAHLHRLHLPDSALHTCEADLLHALSTLLPRLRTEHLVAPWPHDFHPDHETTGRVAATLARELGLTLTFYIFWTWHRGTPDLLRTLPFVTLPLTPAEQHTRLAALRCHESQLHHTSGQPILPEDLLDPAHRPFEVFLPA